MKSKRKNIPKNKTYLVTKKIVADIAENIIHANPGDKIKLNDNEAKILKDYIKE